MFRSMKRVPMITSTARDSATTNGRWYKELPKRVRMSTTRRSRKGRPLASPRRGTVSFFRDIVPSHRRAHFPESDSVRSWYRIRRGMVVSYEGRVRRSRIRRSAWPSRRKPVRPSVNSVNMFRVSSIWSVCDLRVPRFVRITGFCEFIGISSSWFLRASVSSSSTVGLAES